MSVGTDPLAEAARALVRLGPDGLSGPGMEEFAAEVGREHPSRDLYVKATAEALTACGIPEDVADEVYGNFVWTHFVCKLLMTADPGAVIDHALAHIDLSELTASVEGGGAAILSGFHYTGYPLMALAVAMSPIAPLISKARVDVLEGAGGEKHSEHVVYMSDRSAAIRMTRALKKGRSVWVMLDVVLPSVRVTHAAFLGQRMRVGAGLGAIARLSGRPCTPLFWRMTGPAVTLHAGDPIPIADDTDAETAEERLIQDFVDTQSGFITANPAHWLEWYAVLGESPRLRAEVKQGNDQVWARLAKALD
ncbi:hypothetical protein [Actinomadura litoris]|uniref:Lipid A biosynthesis lauroyl acyltransferase n=1 Tax=Actinomadura litoris TaxID=2678616 RepID=A0A7K1L927_9ACTN|nr:hypothetical protein [Actinomadura litoris]MUN40929.1 hypothetical protein [Actinomadura litoris]